MKRLSFLFSFLLAVLLVPTGQAQDLSVHTVTSAGQGGIGGSPMSFTAGADIHADAEPVGISASALYSTKRFTASAGPSFRLVEGANASLDFITSAVYSNGSYEIDPRRSDVFGSKVALRTGTYPLSVTVGVQHLGHAPAYQDGAIDWYNTTRTRTSAVFGFGVSF